MGPFLRFLVVLFGALFFAVVLWLGNKPRPLKWHAIKPGMTKDDVSAILGEPTKCGPDNMGTAPIARGRFITYRGEWRDQFGCIAEVSFDNEWRAVSLLVREPYSPPRRVFDEPWLLGRHAPWPGPVSRGMTKEEVVAILGNPTDGWKTLAKSFAGEWVEPSGEITVVYFDEHWWVTALTYWYAEWYKEEALAPPPQPSKGK
jgi:hypothetical protein